MAAFFQLLALGVGVAGLSVIVTVSVAAALPFCFIWALASAAWTGEIRSFRGGRAGAGPADEHEGPDGRRDAGGPGPVRPGPKAARSSRVDDLRIGRRSHQDRDVARRSYYFGPVAADPLAAVGSARSAFRSLAALGQRMAEDANEADVAAIGIMVKAAMAVGLPVGSAVGAAAVVVLGSVYLAVSAATLVVAVTVGLLLRGLDSAMRFVAGVVMTCWTCGRNVRPYPHYRCPRCGALHRDIRPGEYGVLLRVCVCGTRFPTMLLTGAGRLESVCPHCQGDLPRWFGRAAVIAVPIFGAANAGKTRLMFMMTELLQEWVHEQGGSVRPVGDAGKRLDVISDSLRATGHTEKTLATMPRGLGLEIQIRLHRRLVYFFDAAGELYLREDGLAEMRYLNKAVTYVHVADPLSAKGLWADLSPADQARLEPFQSGDGAVTEVYQRTANQMLKMAPRKKPSNLAFVVSKVDLLGSAGCDIGRTSEEVRRWVSDGNGLDMEDIVRGARQRFAQVRYFGTAAVEEDGLVDASVHELLRWILANEGIKVRAEDA
jgi:hypothetical protein